MEDLGDDGEFFCVKVSNADLETIKGGPLKYFYNTTDKSTFDSCQDDRKSEKIEYIHKKLNL